MYAKNIPLDEFRLVAELVGINVEYQRKSTNVIRFTLKVNSDNPDLYRKLSPQPQQIVWSKDPTTRMLQAQTDNWKWRKGNGICFHGHYRFIEELLKRNPEGIIDSYRLGKVSYTVATFEERAAELGDSPVGPEGNIYHGFQIRDLCNCEGKKL